MSNKVLIIIGAAMNNRGSEALLTGLAQICRKAGAEYIVASSADLKHGKKINIPSINDSFSRYDDFYTKPFVIRILGYLIRILDCTDFITRIKCSRFLKRAIEFDLIVVVGADNFDRLTKNKRELYSLTEIIKRKSKATILLYDCSIDIKHIDRRLIAEFDYFDAITARDRTSYKNIRMSVETDKLHYFPDPAFTMGKEAINSEMDTAQSGIVGLNVSNLISGKEDGETYSLIFNSYCNLIEFIINQYGMTVALIPHVMNNADLSVLRKLYEKYKYTNKVILIKNEQYNARQLKYIISKCQLFIGARTHATIAAYSSCVPTLVLGYSIKSIGIARDLFGTEKNYVISVSELKTEQELVDGFTWLYDNEEGIRAHLIEVMPKYIEEAWKTADLIKDLLKE